MSSFRIALLAASALVLAAPAFAQEGPQVDFPPGGDFENLAPSAGNDTVTIAPETALYMPIWGDFTFPAPNESVTIDFLGGENVINNDGYVFVGVEQGQVLIGGVGSDGLPQLYRDNTRYEAYMRAENLTTFNNTGDIYMGAVYTLGTFLGDALIGTDRHPDDILSLPGAEFVGGAGSRVFLDVNFNNTAAQTACSPSQRITAGVAGDTGSGSLPVADCIDLTGGSASGRTAVHIHDILFGDRGAYNPDGVVIVDMTGAEDGAVTPGAFFVGGSVNTPGYDPRNDGGIDKGLFLYTLGYDSEAQQFKLYGVQSAASNQFPLLAQAANDLWRTASGGWFERQIDQRDRDSRGGGVWGRVSVASADRGVTAFGEAGDKILAFDNSYMQEDTAVTFGADVIVAEGGGAAWAVGAMIGYARSRVDFNDYDNTANLEGMHAGAYGGMSLGAFFLDAAINGTWLDLDNDVPALDLTPAGTKLASKIASLGARVEAGWRMGSDSFSLEPLIGLSHVSTAFDDIDVPADDPSRLGGLVAYEDAVSTRGSLGVRFTMKEVLPMTRVSLTARQVKEFEGEASVSIANIGPTVATAEDTFDGQFSELTAAVTVANDSETVAGYVNLGAMFGDDYDRLAVSAGVRVQW